MTTPGRPAADQHAADAAAAAAAAAARPAFNVSPADCATSITARRRALATHLSAIHHFRRAA